MKIAGIRAGLARHLEGWPVGLAIVSAALLSALLVVPRRVEPVWVPPPVIDRIEQRQNAQLEEERRARARSGLPLAVRSVGEAFRRFAAASFASTAEPALQRDQLRRLARAALEQSGAEGLLQLRALQTELFVQAMQARSDSEPTPDRTSLGGSMFNLGRNRGWFAPSPTAAHRDELETLFRIYWADALDLHAAPFAPTLNEWRVYYRFLLAQPIRPGPDREQDLSLQLGYVAALARHDLDYPAHLARGVLLFQRGAVAEAASEFLAHLEQHPDGPWALRAKNYLAACGAALSD
ncbi:MAG TPA: hypothetical protein VFS67_08665 [Polyangiaceae bacterium]|jgi:hypothetical protein|nr:hypothetical protein [Polyangiaceae bacterium]